MTIELRYSGAFFANEYFECRSFALDRDDYTYCYEDGDVIRIEYSIGDYYGGDEIGFAVNLLENRFLRSGDIEVTATSYYYDTYYETDFLITSYGSYHYKGRRGILGF